MGVIVMVKNEAPILRRLLDSVVPVAHHIFVCDTGSTDDTKEVALSVTTTAISVKFEYIGQFYNFETSRNLCMNAAKEWMPPHVEWLLLPDADFELLHQQQQQSSLLPEYDLNIMQIKSTGAGSAQNALPLLVRANTFFNACRYRLWTHEVLDCCNTTSGYYTPLYWLDHSDGASRPQKITRDINLLEEWIYHYNRTLAKSPTEKRQDLYGRALYYLARAYEDAGHPEQALQFYRLHEMNQPWTNYQFQGRYRSALLKLAHFMKNKEENDWKPVEDAFLDAFGGADGYFRREVLYHLMWMFGEIRQWNRCILYASAGLSTPPIDHSRMPLFLETEKYQDSLFQKGLDFCVYHSKNSPLG